MDLFSKTTKEIAEYIGQTYKQGGNICVAVEALQHLRLPAPAALGGSPTLVETGNFNESIKEYIEQMGILDKNI